jgi:hypothetical protein
MHVIQNVFLDNSIHLFHTPHSMFPNEKTKQHPQSERNVPVPLLGRPGPDDVAQALPNI